jgi:hypothetical protein
LKEIDEAFGTRTWKEVISLIEEANLLVSSEAT